MNRVDPLGWRCRDRVLSMASRPLIMGILNVTPDSFSDGGRYRSAEAAIAHGLAMARDGADIIDVGGESTRPGAAPVAVEEERARVVPVIEGLRAALSAAAGDRDAPVISVDTRKSAVAAAALEAGARIINDVSALTHDPAMSEVARRYRAGLILMHMRGDPATMQQSPQYTDVVAEVAAYLQARIAALCAAGLERETVAVDPGIGFGKTTEHNLQLLARLDVLKACGRPIAVGVSRKSFLGKITGRGAAERGPASLAGMVCAVLQGADIVRVHAVGESADAAKVIAALRRESGL